MKYPHVFPYSQEYGEWQADIKAWPAILTSDVAEERIEALRRYVGKVPAKQLALSYASARMRKHCPAFGLDESPNAELWGEIAAELFVAGVTRGPAAGFIKDCVVEADRLCGQPHTSIAMRALFDQAWLQGALQVVLVSDALTSALLATSLKGMLCEDVRLGAPIWLSPATPMALPSGLRLDGAFIGEFPDGEERAIGLMARVKNTEGGSAWMAFCLPLTNGKSAVEAIRRLDGTTKATTEGERRAFSDVPTLWRWVLGAILYRTCKDADIAREFAGDDAALAVLWEKSRKAAKGSFAHRRAKEQADALVKARSACLLGGKVVIDRKIETATAEAVTTGRTLSVRFMVRGHWRKCASGKIVWVAPHMRGPKDAPMKALPVAEMK